MNVDRRIVGGWSRFGMAGFTWALLVLALPGMGRHHGFGHLAFVALVPWGLVCSRPGPRAFLAEWAAAAIGLAVSFLWMRTLLPGLIPLMGIVPALWPAAAGVLLRRLARRYPLALAVPVAWMVGELARWLLPVPLSFGWWRLGTMAHDSLWLAGSARIWGVWGLSFVFAAFAGGVADGLRARDLERPWSRVSKVLGFGPLALAVALSLGVRPPPTRPGPRVLIVQPGIEQKRKTWSADPFRDLFVPSCEMTREALAELEAAGEPPPDLVGWGESMLTLPVVEPSAVEGVARGLQPLEWAGWDVQPGQLEYFVSGEEELVEGLLFGRPDAQGARLAALGADGPAWVGGVLAGRPLLPPGTSFFCGAESIFAHDGAIRRRNAAFLWSPTTGRSAPAPKVNLVPGAEDMRGFHRLPFMLDLMLSLGGYVPDLVAAESTVVLPLATRSGDTYRMATTVCFDNAFDAPYTEPLRRGPVDFHILASNEAWYERTVEMDQMAAFSRLVAQSTGRSVVRVTNSGISMVIDPSGAEVAALEVDGERKMVRGTLAATVPVPVRDAGGRAPATLFVRTEPYQLWGWGLAALVLALGARNGGGPVGRRSQPVGNPGGEPG